MVPVTPAITRTRAYTSSGIRTVVEEAFPLWWRGIVTLQQSLAQPRRRGNLQRDYLVQAEEQDAAVGISVPDERGQTCRGN